MANAFWNFVLNKGWAGKSLSRQETVERLNPLIRLHVELNHAYSNVAQHFSDADFSSELDRLQKTARTDVGKLRETVLSCGGVAYSGVDLEPEDFDFGDSDETMVSRLQEQEQALLDQTEEELGLNGIEHHMRTKAILENLRNHSRERLDFLKSRVQQAVGAAAS